MNHNMLVDYLPETVEIDGAEYVIESNFRTYILFEMMMQDPELSDDEKARQGLELSKGQKKCRGSIPSSMMMITSTQHF